MIKWNRCYKRALSLIIGIWIITQAQEIGARYLIITHDNYYDLIQPLANWKHKKGMRAKIVRLSQIGGTAVEIRNYIFNAYNTWPCKPEYILFVGAPNFLPFPQVGTTYSDNYYTNMDGDIYNEILSGRLTVHSTYEAQTVVNKILLYERTPDTTDSLWFRKACLIVNTCGNSFDDSIYWSDARHAAGLMVNNNYCRIDTLSDIYGHNATTIINSVNDGRSFVMYRGSGLNNWSDPFNVNADLTSNGTKLPIVLSITCRTIGTSATPAFAEKWHLTGGPTSPRGASGYFATTTVVTEQAYLRSAVAKGFFNTLFVENKKTFGEACEGGRLNVYAMYPYQGGDKEYYGFTTLGDPEMNIWTGTPCLLTVNHPPNIPLGNANFSMTVLKAGDLSPISRAIVCLLGKIDSTVYAVDTTDTNGYAYFSIIPHVIEDTIYVTVTGRNLKPYEGFMIVRGANTPYILYLRSVIDDSLRGNNNKLINPGETINLPLWVLNWGDSTGFSVTGLLRTNDIYTTITDSFKSFLCVFGRDSAFTGEDGYKFFVAESCPDGETLSFELVCRDINDSVWVSHFNKEVHAAELVFQEAIVSGGNGNTNWEPGETVTVVVTVKNEGSGAIDSVKALLKSASPYAVIIDSVGSYNHIGSDSIADNVLNPFIVFADSGTPQGTIVDFQMTISAGYYLDTLTFSLVIGKKDYYIWNYDRTPIPGQNIHSILTALGYNGDIGPNLTSDLNLYQVVFVCVGVFPNNNIIYNSSPEANALVNFLQNLGGHIYLEGADVWYYDPLYMGGYNFGPIFRINATGDGSSDMGPVVGQPITFTNGMNFAYSGENNFMDHISPENASAFLIFHDGDNYYDCGVAYNAGTYRTVGTSFELGYLIDGTPPSTRAALLDSIMHFFNVSTVIAEENNTAGPCLITFTVSPNPFSSKIVIKFEIRNPFAPLGASAFQTGKSEILLKIYDALGRLVRRWDYETMRQGNQISWDGTDHRGNKLPKGVYFIHFKHGEFSKTEKVIYLR